MTFSCPKDEYFGFIRIFGALLDWRQEIEQSKRRARELQGFPSEGSVKRTNLGDPGAEDWRLGAHQVAP